MSEIRATTISDLAGTGPATLTGQYAAKAWVNFNGTGTIAIRNSENVSSLTDNGTANYNVNFSSSFSAADYASFGSGIGDSTSTNRVDCVVASINAPSASSVNIGTRNSGSAIDPTHVNYSVFGDLA